MTFAGLLDQWISKPHSEEEISLLSSGLDSVSKTTRPTQPPTDY